MDQSKTKQETSDSHRVILFYSFFIFFSLLCECRVVHIENFLTSCSLCDFGFEIVFLLKLQKSKKLKKHVRHRSEDKTKSKSVSFSDSVSSSVSSPSAKIANNSNLPTTLSNATTTSNVSNPTSMTKVPTLLFGLPSGFKPPPLRKVNSPPSQDPHQPKKSDIEKESESVAKSLTQSRMSPRSLSVNSPPKLKTPPPPPPNSTKPRAISSVKLTPVDITPHPRLENRTTSQPQISTVLQSKKQQQQQNFGTQQNIHIQKTQSSNEQSNSPTKESVPKLSSPLVVSSPAPFTTPFIIPPTPSTGASINSSTSPQNSSGTSQSTQSQNVSRTTFNLSSPTSTTTTTTTTAAHPQSRSSSPPISPNATLSPSTLQSLSSPSTTTTVTISPTSVQPTATQTQIPSAVHSQLPSSSPPVSPNATVQSATSSSASVSPTTTTPSTTSKTTTVPIVVSVSSPKKRSLVLNRSATGPKTSPLRPSKAKRPADDSYLNYGKTIRGLITGEIDSPFTFDNDEENAVTDIQQSQGSELSSQTNEMTSFVGTNEIQTIQTQREMSGFGNSLNSGVGESSGTDSSLTSQNSNLSTPQSIPFQSPTIQSHPNQSISYQQFDNSQVVDFFCCYC